MADPTQGNPPKPGDPVPDGGLDPTQVFGSPPPPKPASAGAGTTGDDGAAPAQDKSPPPPPVGTAATKEAGYDDEDIRILADVGDYRFGSIMATLTNENVAIPAHAEAKFDDQQFLTLLRGSISLTRDEKWRIVQAVPKLSQFQIDELQKILDEERFKFSQLSPKHLKHLQQLEKKHAEDWKDLQSMYVQAKVKEKESSEADDIRKQLGL